MNSIVLPSVAILAVVAAVVAALVLTGCSRSEPPACQPAELARIEAAFAQEAIASCAGKTITTCAEYPAIKAKYQAQREAWVSCR